MKKLLNPLHQDIAKWAKQLRTVDFPDLDGDFDREFFEKADLKCTHFVYPMPRQSGFRVSMTVLGTEHTLGYFASGQAAGRFADMCLMRFHHLRRMGHIPLTDQNMNFSLQQVKWDIEDIPQAVIFLDAIAESPLFDKAVVKASLGEQSNSPTGESAVSQPDERLNMLLDCVGDLSRKIDDLAKLITALTTSPR